MPLCLSENLRGMYGSCSTSSMTFRIGIARIDAELRENIR